MDIKYNIYVSTSPEGPWVLNNPIPIDHDQLGNEYTITDVIRDALYYNDQKEFETALVSISYCEGLLDALRLLRMVEFQWSKDRQ